MSFCPAYRSQVMLLIRLSLFPDSVGFQTDSPVHIQVEGCLPSSIAFDLELIGLKGR